MAEKQPDTKPREIIFECQKDLSEEMAANLPTYSASRQLCRNSKTDKYKQYAIQNDLTFVLHEDFILIGKRLFLLYDNYNELDDQERMVIFSTEKNLQLLNEYRNW